MLWPVALELLAAATGQQSVCALVVDIAYVNTKDSHENGAMELCRVVFEPNKGPDH